MKFYLKAQNIQKLCFRYAILEISLVGIVCHVSVFLCHLKFNTISTRWYFIYSLLLIILNSVLCAMSVGNFICCFYHHLSFHTIWQKWNLIHSFLFIIFNSALFKYTCTVVVTWLLIDINRGLLTVLGVTCFWSTKELQNVLC